MTSAWDFHRALEYHLRRKVGSPFSFSRVPFGDVRSKRIRISIVYLSDSNEKKAFKGWIKEVVESFTKGVVKVKRVTINSWNAYAAGNRQASDDAYFANIYVEAPAKWWRNFDYKAEDFRFI